MRKHELTEVERALICLAAYMENPNHSDYRVKQEILDMLGLVYQKDATPPTAKAGD